jgi:hypothetical protein
LFNSRPVNLFWLFVPQLCQPAPPIGPGIGIADGRTGTILLMVPVRPSGKTTR